MKKDEINRLKYFPITVFAAIMGLTGFTIVLSKLYHLKIFPEWPYLMMIYLTTFLFFLFITLYSLKFTFYFEEVKKDFNHKIRINFITTIPICLLLLSIAYMGIWPIASIGFLYLGGIIHTFLLFKILTKWINHDFDIHHFNPAWFIPVVGIILIPILGVNFLPKYVSLFYLAGGLFFWIILTTILFYRLIFHKPLANKLKPTLFIIVAPPAVGFVSYMRLLMSWDIISQSLLFLTYFFVIILFFLRNNFKKMDFFMSWWAFSFPMAAITIASIVAFMVTKKIGFFYILNFMSVCTIILIIYLLYNTIINILKRNICIKED